MAAEDFWGNRPLRLAAPPAVERDTWARTTIDRFVLSRLERADLSPSPPADRYTLLRRLTIDLTGLPPSVGEVESFVSDRAPGAYERVVDRLLASPAFGDHWAQRWFDLSCFADLTDVNGTVVARDAWRYRDYVVDSFNSDKPLDRFIREQVAGDLLPAADDAQRREQIIATGFLAIGPWVLQNYIKPQMLADVVDHQIEKIGRTFLGLSLACARCHDHKFDPVPTRDYYALAGIFHSTVTTSHTGPGVWSTITKVRLPETATEKAERAVAEKQYEAELERLDRCKTELTEERERLRREQQELPPGDSRRAVVKERLDALEKELGEIKTERDLRRYNHPRPPEAMALEDASQPRNSPVYLRGDFESLGEIVPRGFLANFVDSSPPPSAGQSGRRELADWIVGADLPLTTRVLVNRVWHQMIGAGLVRTVDDFGKHGDRPSHPDLLDHLALSFREDGWSLKRLIRRIALSSVYRMSSAHDARAAEKDPEVRLLWRMHRRRLQAESIHDSIRWLSGTLDGGRGGPCLGLDIPGNVAGLGNQVNPPVWKPTTLPAHIARRRVVYLPVARNRPKGYLEILGVFDSPPPNEIRGRRELTNAPPQALFLMNSPFVKEQARHAASYLLSRAADDRERLEDLFLRAWGRPPQDTEVKEALRFLQSYAREVSTLEPPPADPRLEAWSQYCQATFASAEFLFRN